MKKIFITGATGNVGMELIKALYTIPNDLMITAGVKDIEKDIEKLTSYSVNSKLFDFLDISTYAKALENSDIIFFIC
jgi:short-subunit dehydrogenase